MKCTVDKKEKESIKYPILGEWRENGLIVLLSKEGCGTCLNAGTTGNVVGEYATNWASLSTFNGSIALEND